MENAPGVSFHDYSAGGETGRLIREKDWSAHPLGPMHSWSRSLSNHVKMILELPTAAIVFWGPDLIQLYNDGYSVIMGPRHPRHLGSPFRDCWPEAYESIHPWMERVLQNGETVQVNRTLVPLTRFGFVDEGYFTFSFSPLRDDEGRIAGILQLVTEVTDAVLWERRETMLREIVNQTAHAKTANDALGLATAVLGKNASDIPFALIYLVDSRGKLILSRSTGLSPAHEPWLNQLAQAPELVQVARERKLVLIEDLAARFGPLTVWPWPEPLRLAFAAPIAAGDQRSATAVLVGGVSPRLAFDKSYESFLQLICTQLATLMAAARVHDDERERAAHLEARVAERTAELERSEDQLRQAQKMEAVGRLAGGVAHDFNNLLSVILSYAEMLLAEEEVDSARRGDLEEIFKAGERAAQLTRQMLAFSRQQVLEARVLDLNDVVWNLHKMLSRVVGEDIAIKVVAAPQLRRVRADPGQLEQVIMNLVVNARDAMATGGVLTIETANLELDEAYTRAHVGATAGPHVLLAVSDSGVGMDAATQARIFEPFFTTKEKGKGTGLGLSTVYGIVKQSGGSIWVYSEPGVGTTFKIYLPVAKGSSDRVPMMRPKARVGAGNETILLVEDQDEVRVAASRILKRATYHVLEARSPADAILICEKHAAKIHLLLTDVVMPQMGGRLLAERLMAMRPNMKLLFMSGYTDDAVLNHGILDSDVAFVQKPLTPDALTKKVREVLDTAAVRS